MVERLLIALPSQLQLIDRLQHLIYLSSSLIFVSGAQGSGKTVLMEQLSNQLPKSIKETFICLNEALPDEQIRQKIITQLFDHPLFDAHDSLFSSFSQLQEKFNINIPQVIIIDNAQYISSALLAELVQLITLKVQISESEINVLLLGNGDSNEQQLSLINQQMQSNDPHCSCLEFKVEPLNDEESIALLDLIFKQNSYQPQLQHQDAVNKQLQGCSGRPQKIIELAEKIIAGKLQYNEISKLRARIPALLLLCLLLLIAVALAMHLKPKFFDTLTTKDIDETVIETENFTIKEIEATDLVANDNLSESVVTVDGEALAGNWSNKQVADVIDNQLMVGISDETAARVIISQQEIAATTAETSELIVVLQENPISQETDPITNDIGQNLSVNTLEGSHLQVMKETKTIDLDEASEVVSKNNEAEVPAIALAIKIESQSIATIEIALEKNNDPLFTATEKLLAIPATHFTLQLAAMDSKLSLQQFVRKHNLPQKNVFVYQTKQSNKPRYVVIVGEYANWKLAQQASKKLPGSLANMDSWIKKYNLVHQDLQLNND